MKKSDLKKIIKPLVKECINEVLLEEGLLSGIVSEVAKGMAPQPLVEMTTQRLAQQSPTESSKEFKEHRKRMIESVNKDVYNGVNLFEGTTPAPAEASPTQQASALSGQSSEDPGVDISGLLGSVSTHWGAHMTEVKK